MDEGLKPVSRKELAEALLAICHCIDFDIDYDKDVRSLIINSMGVRKIRLDSEDSILIPVYAFRRIDSILNMSAAIIEKRVKIIKAEFELTINALREQVDNLCSEVNEKEKTISELNRNKQDLLTELADFSAKFDHEVEKAYLKGWGEGKTSVGTDEDTDFSDAVRDLVLRSPAFRVMIDVSRELADYCTSSLCAEKCIYTAKSASSSYDNSKIGSCFSCSIRIALQYMEDYFNDVYGKSGFFLRKEVLD